MMTFVLEILKRCVSLLVHKRAPEAHRTKQCRCACYTSTYVPKKRRALHHGGPTIEEKLLKERLAQNEMVTVNRCVFDSSISVYSYFPTPRRHRTGNRSQCDSAASFFGFCYRFSLHLDGGYRLTIRRPALLIELGRFAVLHTYVV